MRKFIFVILLFSATASSSQDSLTNKFALGVDSISVYSRCYQFCDTNIVFLQLHQDEVTGLEAAEDYFYDNAGTLVNLQHTGKRLLDFEFRYFVYNIDPNRIFSAKGIKENLGKQYNLSVSKVVDSFAKNILQKYIDNKKLVVALHNNTNNRFSILSYSKGQPEAPNAATLHINPLMDPDDFILTTDTSIYRKIKDKNINVVLQSIRAKDDGSLSVYAQKNNIPYINIEAEHGHFYEQREMLYALKEVFDQYTELLELNYSNPTKK